MAESGCSESSLFDETATIPSCQEQEVGAGDEAGCGREWVAGEVSTVRIQGKGLSEGPAATAEHGAEHGEEHGAEVEWRRLHADDEYQPVSE